MTTSSLAPSTDLTIGGISESTTAPTSQNQLTTSEPHHSRGSRRSSPSSEPVERAMFGSTRNSGAPWPVRGIKRLAPQQKNENTTIIVPKIAGWVPSLAARPPTMVPSRIAMKVAPSTSALPAGSSSFFR